MIERRGFMRKICVFVLCLSLLLTGCSGEARIRRGTESVNPDSIVMSYERFDGERSYEIELPQDTQIRVEIRTVSGQIKVTVEQEGQEPIYSGRISEDFAFALNADAGTYTVTLTGEKHVGSYRFEWETN